MFDIEKTLLEAQMNGKYEGTQIVLSRDQLKAYTELVVNEVIEVLDRRHMGDYTREDQEVRRCIISIENHFDTNRSG